DLQDREVVACLAHLFIGCSTSSFGGALGLSSSVFGRGYAHSSPLSTATTLNLNLRVESCVRPPAAPGPPDRGSSGRPLADARATARCCARSRSSAVGRPAHRVGARDRPATRG